MRRWVLERGFGEVASDARPGVAQAGPSARRSRSGREMRTDWQRGYVQCTADKAGFSAWAQAATGRWRALVRRWVLERWLSCAPTVAPWGCRPRRVAPSPARSRVTLDRESRKSGSSASRSRAGREAADGLAERVCAVHRGQGGREGGECERDGPARPAGGEAPPCAYAYLVFLNRPLSLLRSDLLGCDTSAEFLPSRHGAAEYRGQRCPARRK